MAVQYDLYIDRPLKSPLGVDIQKSYNALMKVVLSFSKAERNHGVIQGYGSDLISISDIIAYQIGWGSLLISWYESGINNCLPDMPGEGFLTWDYLGLARHFYTKYHLDGFEKQNQIFFNRVNVILDIIENEYDSGNLEAIGVWEWCTLKSGKKWALSKWIRINTVAPYKRALVLIKKTLK